jgi:hypothetical protein
VPKSGTMAEDQDQLFTRLIQHYEGQGRVDRPGPDSGGTHAMTRRVFIRYGNNAAGLLEIQTVALIVTDADASKRQITWTRNARLPQDPEPLTDDRGSRMTPIDRWDEALAAIDGSPST